MGKTTKNQKSIDQAHDFSKTYSLLKGLELLKATSYTKFDATVDVAVRLGVDPKKSDQMVRGTVMLPHGTGKIPIVLALCTADKEQEARKAGADYVGLDDYIEKLSSGWTDLDAIVTMPSIMPKLGKLGKILGPKGLMPNPKSGTVTMEVGQAVQAIKSGKIDFTMDKYGIVHAGIGKVSFPVERLQDNVLELLSALGQCKPSGCKGVYIRHISVSSTMGRGVTVDTNLPV